MISSHFILAQTFSSKERRKEAEIILNTVINSFPFDSVYSHRQVYFLANDLLTESSPLILKRKKCKAKILRRDKIKDKLYVVLGDFTLDWNNNTTARVQLEIMPQKKLLSIGLLKIGDIWIVKNYEIFDD